MYCPSEASTTVIYKEPIGAISPFKPGDDWPTFKERLELYFEANLIEYSRKIPVLLLSVSLEVYQILRNLCNPQLPKAKSYHDLIDLLSKQFQPKSCVHRQRILFDSLKQGAESVNDWHTTLVSVASRCEFGPSLDERIIGKFVAGMRAGPILDRLCEEDISAELNNLMDIALKKEAEINGLDAYSNAIDLTNKRDIGSRKRKLSEDKLCYCYNEELETPNRVEYTFYPNTSGYIRFKVRASSNAQIALTSIPEESDPMYEIFIGYGGNLKSFIRKNCTEPYQVEVSTPNILDANEFRTFWICWNNNTISVGYENNPYSFMSWTDNEHVPVCYVGFCTGDSKGSWVISQAGTPRDDRTKLKESRDDCSRPKDSCNDSSKCEEPQTPDEVNDNFSWIDIDRCSVADPDDIELETPDRLHYTFYPNNEGYIKFKVRGSSNAHIALTTTSAESDPMYEVFIGGWHNTKCAIRKNRTNPNKIEVSTPNILEEDEFRAFWVCWNNNTISAGYDNNPRPFITWTDIEHVPICYVGVCTGWGATGSWIIQQGGKPLGISQDNKWSATTGRIVPAYGFVGGEDRSSLLYVIRCNYQGSVIPGKYHSGYKTAYIPWNGLEVELYEYEMLCNCTGKWVPCTKGNIPSNAIKGGQTADGETLYIGRAYAPDGTIAIGKVQTSRRYCYIPYGGKEYRRQKYEILVY